MAGIKFLDDILYVLDDQWVNTIGGKKPEFRRELETKQVGTGTNNYDLVMASLDAESVQEFGMLIGDATNWEDFDRDWLHEVSVTLDVRTGKSLDRIEQLVNSCVSILKSRTVPIIDNTQYVHLKIEGLTSLNETYTNIYRYLISVVGIRENPTNDGK